MSLLENNKMNWLFFEIQLLVFRVLKRDSLVQIEKLSQIS
jgi:hypothetical protein